MFNEGGELKESFIHTALIKAPYVIFTNPNKNPAELFPLWACLMIKP
jgi:hypothetical protein